MPRPTKKNPERGGARIRLMEAAVKIVRSKGFAATTVDDLCQDAGVTKGAFFHHFASKEHLGKAAADHWAAATGALFELADYHRHADPAQRVLAYLAFRRAIIGTEPAEFSCLAGTMVQEAFRQHPAIRDACADCILGHAATLEPDIQAAMDHRALKPDWTAAGLALHTQAVLQGAFVIAKATGDPAVARDSIDHLIRYVTLLFSDKPQKG